MKQITKYLSTKVNPSTIKADDMSINKIVQSEIERFGPKADLNHIDVSEVTKLSNTFYHTEFNGDVSKWNVENVTVFSFTFSANPIFDGYLGDWDVYNATSMDSMFNWAEKFTGNGLEKWSDKLKKCKNMEYMFQHCIEFTGKNVENWKLSSSIKSVEKMFNECINLDCDLRNWQLNKSTKHHYMMHLCKKMSQFKFPKYYPNHRESIS